MGKHANYHNEHAVWPEETNDCSKCNDEFEKELAASAIRNYLASIGAKGGKIGGKATSKRKQDASRHNGHKGGRPKKAVQS